MILIFLAMLLLFGAKNLPKVARNLGKTMEEFRRAAHDVSSEIMNADDESNSYTSPTALPPVELTPPSGEDPEILDHPEIMKDFEIVEDAEIDEDSEIDEDTEIVEEDTDDAP